MAVRAAAVQLSSGAPQLIEMTLLCRAVSCAACEIAS